MRHLATALLLTLLITAAPALAAPTHQLTVDGTTYAPTKVTGGAVHYYTPAPPQPTAASSERHIWDPKHGAEHLPCTGRLHWIDNANLLTISHCEEAPDVTTTTSEPPPTTTTVPQTTTSTTEPPVTTTTGPPDTTTTEPPTTTVPSETTTSAPTTTTLPEECDGDDCELPYTGFPLTAFALVGGALLVLGAAAVRASAQER